MKVRPRKIETKERIRYLDALYTAAASLRSREEMKNFLKDLLTESERIMIGRRILIAQRLLENKTYDEIINELHVGVDTITRVHKWLEDESEGYEKAIKGLEKELKSRASKAMRGGGEPYSFSWLKKRYPLHFLLFNLLDKVSK